MCTNGGGSAPRIMVFRPSYEEMKDFPAYIAYIESQGANKAGLAKIIPPKEWCPRAGGYDNIDLNIPAPISQIVHGRQGLYQQINIQKKSMSVQDFQKLAESEKYRTPNHFDYEDLERKYWRNITYNSPIYGADVSGSLYDPKVKEFNINRLESILDMVNEDYGIRIEGVNTAYLYFGMWKTSFPWHTEDMDLYSINYLHFGAPKSWYAIPPEHGRRLERLATGFFPGHSKSCAAFLRHKMTIISPAILKQYSIPFNKITQEPGEFMVTFPFGYHAGFNHGYNCAESTNFAMPRWVEYGKRALQCSCRKDGVKISMDVFMRKFQPERYDLWKAGRDVGAHPEDPSRVSAAPAPTKMELTACSRADERRRYRTESGSAISKRHPISHVDGIKQEYCSEEEAHSDDTEIYDIGEMEVETKKVKRKKKEKRHQKDDDASAAKDKTKKKIKRKDGLASDKIKVKKVKIKKEVDEFYQTGDSTKHQETPVKLTISKKCIPSPTDDAQTVTEFKVTATSHSDSGDNSNLMALAQLAEDVSLRMDAERLASRSNFPGLLMPCQVSVTKYLSQPMVKVVTLPAAHIQLSSSSTTTTHRIPYDTTCPQNAVPAAGFVDVTPPGGDPDGNVSWSRRQNDISRYLPLSTTVLASPNISQQPQNLADSVCTSISLLKKPLRVDLQETCRSTIGSHSLPTARLSTQQQMDFDESLQKETCFYESGYLPQAAHMQQHQKLHKMLHDYARLESELPGCEVLNLSKKPQEVQLEGWAKELSNLWQFKPSDFDAEKAFNAASSFVDPHCAICTVFKASRKDAKCEKVQLPSSSAVLMPSSVFSSITVDQFVVDNNPLLAPEGTAPLLQCCRCQVCVHATCYGVTQDELVSEWKCVRCRKEAMDAACCLCLLRGGALKITVDGRWVHVLCAALVPGTLFGNTITKEPIDVSKIKKERLKLVCMYCHKFAAKRSGMCIQCSSGKCSNSFHVTCGHAAGVIFETSIWPTPIYITCTRHTSVREKKGETRPFVEVKVGDKAVAKHKNKRYYNCEVQKIDRHVFYAVDFEDGSFSENLYPQDIVSRNCVEFGPPKINETVEVQWTDGNRYRALFKGTRTQVVYTVEFDDGSQLQIRRDDFYTSNEKLPKRVLSRMSCATDGQHTDIFEDQVDGKRIRFVNTKYHSSEVVPL